MISMNTDKNTLSENNCFPLKHIDTIQNDLQQSVVLICFTENKLILYYGRGAAKIFRKLFWQHLFRKTKLIYHSFKLLLDIRNKYVYYRYLLSYKYVFLVSRQSAEWTSSRMHTNSNGHHPEWTPFQMGTISNGQHFKWATFQMGNISNGRHFKWATFQMGDIPNEHNPEWARFRMNTIPNGLDPECTQSQMDAIPNGHHLEWTPSRMDTIPNGHHPQWVLTFI